MNVIAIDTSSQKHSIAIRNNTKIISHTTTNIHNDSLFETINSLLNKMTLEYSDINTILCNVGPGSFTGIRIGVAAVRGIKKVLPNIKIIGITAMECIAYTKNKTTNNNTSFYVAINAFGNELYIQKFNYLTKQESEILIVHQEDFITTEYYDHIVSNEESIIALCKQNNKKTEFVQYDAENIINFFDDYPDTIREVKPLYIKKPNIHHGAFRNK